MGESCSRHGRDEREVHTKFWSENLKGTDNPYDLGVEGRIILEWILGKQDGKL
jgi:hypothetical protein